VHTFQEKNALLRELFFMIYSKNRRLEMKFLNTEEAGAELGISASQVTRLITSGRLKATKFGRDWLISPADLKMVDERKKTGRPIGSKDTRPREAKKAKKSAKH
jgi:excisionase family DNA binding protein